VKFNMDIFVTLIHPYTGYHQRLFM